MKKLLFLSGMLFLGLMASAQQTPASPRVTAETENVKVAYGQPSKKGRVIFGDKEKYGKVWRAGANEATEITFAKDGTFGGQPVKAGTYTLFVTPTEKDWTVILNSSMKQWGSFKYEEIKDKDVLKVTVPTKKTDNVVEKLTYRFAGSDLIIEWDQTMVAVPVSFK
ncbi:MAG: DUF2911 domain-containing protein [Chitinophagaceae bacterium]